MTPSSRTTPSLSSGSRGPVRVERDGDAERPDAPPGTLPRPAGRLRRGGPGAGPAQPGTDPGCLRLVRFPYQRFLARDDPSDAPTRYRPVIRARVIGLSGDAIVHGLLDTGAEDTLLDLSYIDLLDIVIKPDAIDTLVSTTGHLFQVL